MPSDIEKEASFPNKKWILSLLERLAQSLVGKVLLNQLDNFLWMIEKCMEWSLPQIEGSPDEKTSDECIKRSDLMRPMPWILFIPSLILLRTIRVGLSICAYLCGWPMISPNVIIKLLRRIRLRLKNLQKPKDPPKSDRHEEEKRLSMNEAKKALIRSIRLTLSTLSCMDGSKPSLSPPPTKIHVSALDLDALETTNDFIEDSMLNDNVNIDDSETKNDEGSTFNDDNETIASNIRPTEKSYYKLIDENIEEEDEEEMEEISQEQSTEQELGSNQSLTETYALEDEENITDTKSDEKALKEIHDEMKKHVLRKPYDLEKMSQNLERIIEQQEHEFEQTEIENWQCIEEERDVTSEKIIQQKQDTESVTKKEQSNTQKTINKQKSDKEQQRISEQKSDTKLERVEEQTQYTGKGAIKKQFITQKQENRWDKKEKFKEQKRDIKQEEVTEENQNLEQESAIKQEHGSREELLTEEKQFVEQKQHTEPTEYADQMQNVEQKQNINQENNIAYSTKHDINQEQSDVINFNTELNIGEQQDYQKPCTSQQDDKQDQDVTGKQDVMNNPPQQLEKSEWDTSIVEKTLSKKKRDKAKYKDNENRRNEWQSSSISSIEKNSEVKMQPLTDPSEPQNISPSVSVSSYQSARSASLSDTNESSKTPQSLRNSLTSLLPQSIQNSYCTEVAEASERDNSEVRFISTSQTISGRKFRVTNNAAAVKRCRSASKYHRRRGRRGSHGSRKKK